MAQFSPSSLKRLKTCHPDLVRVFDLAIDNPPCDFGIACGSRMNREDQEAAFLSGASKAHFGESPHNFEPSFAADIYPVVPGLNFFSLDTRDHPAWGELADHIFACANALGVELVWGGDWHGDGDATVNDAWDKPHFEIHGWRKMRP